MQFSLLKHLWIIGLSLILALTFSPLPTKAEPANGAQIFSVHCAGCHFNGGNIVRRGKNLKLKTLQKNGFDSIEAIAQIVTNGKNNMSAYKDRLSQAEIEAVSTYVWEQAQTGWKP
jgi:cytochrome c6